MQGILLGIHVVLAICLIVLILLQRGKGADAGAAFGSGASGTVFGASGSASFLTRTTAVLALLFFSNSAVLAYLAADSSAPQSVMGEAASDRRAALEENLETQDMEIQESSSAPPGAAEGGAASSDLPEVVEGAVEQPTEAPPQPAEETTDSDLPKIPES